MEHTLIVNGVLDDGPISDQLLNSLNTSNEIEFVPDNEKALALINSFYQGIRSFPEIIVLSPEISIMDGLLFIEAFRRLHFAQKDNVIIVMLPVLDRFRKEIGNAKIAGIGHFQTETICSALQLTILLSTYNKSQKMFESGLNNDKQESQKQRIQLPAPLIEARAHHHFL